MEEKKLLYLVSLFGPEEYVENIYKVLTKT
mgnify:CR=1 FL=1